MMPPGYRQFFLREPLPDGPMWLELGEMFADRFGWHWECPSPDGPMWLELGELLDERLAPPPERPTRGDLTLGCWCYGLVGACRLKLTVSEGQFIIHVSERDRVYLAATLLELNPQLARLEADYDGLTPAQSELIEYLLPSKLAEWERG